MKFFETFTIQSQILLKIICLNFEHVYVNKPQTSRPTNSEKYVIAMNFNGTPLFTNELIRIYYDKIDEELRFVSKSNKDIITNNIELLNLTLAERQGVHIYDTLSKMTVT